MSKPGIPASVCVVGAGIIGSWTALHLAEAGVATTLVDQFPAGHSKASSHGSSRGFRYLGDLDLSRLDYSMQRWKLLEKHSGMALFVKTGMIQFCQRGDDWMNERLDVLRGAGRACEWLEPGEIHRRFPMLRYPPDWYAGLDPEAGMLLADHCLASVHARFVTLGGEIVNARADRTDTPGRLYLDSAEYGPVTRDFGQVVLCPGPWAPGMLPELPACLATQLIAVTYWQDLAGNHSVKQGFPLLYNARLTGIYGLPSYEHPGLVKILAHGGPEAGPEVADLSLCQPQIDRTRAYIRAHLPGIDHRAPARMEPCRYTVTPDSEPIVQRLDERTVIACGFSGSGFKHSPAFGLMAASIAQGREDGLPAGFETHRYRYDRFAS